MNPPRFHCPFPLAVGARAELMENASRHAMKVLRLTEGDSLTLFDGRGGEYTCRLCPRENGSGAVVDVLDWHAIERESPLDLTLAQALQVGEKMDLTVQKAVELGVGRIAPLVTQRGMMRLSGERAKKRVAHWRAVAVSACEQCGRNRVPEIADPEDLQDWLLRPARNAALRLMLDPRATLTLGALPAPDAGRIELLVGAEGGLTPEEAEQARQAGFTAVCLGPRVLRTETAGLAALAAIQCLWGDFSQENL